MKFLIAAVGVLLVGCQTGEGDANRATHTWQSTQGTMALDRVNGHRIDASKAVTRNYLGEPYYFESEDNARKFDSNPWSYLYDHNNPERSASPGTQGAFND